MTKKSWKIVAIIIAVGIAVVSCGFYVALYALFSYNEPLGKVLPEFEKYIDPDDVLRIEYVSKNADGEITNIEINKERGNVEYIIDGINGAHVKKTSKGNGERADVEVRIVMKSGEVKSLSLISHYVNYRIIEGTGYAVSGISHSSYREEVPKERG